MCLDRIHSCSSEARRKFVLNLKPSTDKMLQTTYLCVLKCYIIYMKYFIFLRFSSCMIRGVEAPKVFGQKPLPQKQKNTKQLHLVIAVHVWGECQCGLDKDVTAHTALLPSDIFYVLVPFILYFYCLLNDFFWLCFVWTSVQRKQFCSEKHFAHCPEEKQAGALLAYNH